MGGECSQMKQSLAGARERLCSHFRADRE